VIADMKHIAQSAKRLVTLQEPPARVWHTIRRRLERQEDVPRNADSRAWALSSVEW